MCYTLSLLYSTHYLIFRCTKYNLTSVYLIACFPPKVQFPSITILNFCFLANHSVFFVMEDQAQLRMRYLGNILLVYLVGISVHKSGLQKGGLCWRNKCGIVIDWVVSETMNLDEIILKTIKNERSEGQWDETVKNTDILGAGRGGEPQGGRKEVVRVVGWR